MKMKGMDNVLLFGGGIIPQKDIQELKKMGIKTVVNLRTDHDDEKQIAGTGLQYFLIPMSPSDPQKKSFQQFLDIATNPAMQPVFVHCRHGADRTGTAVALYRIKVQGWDLQAALRELKEGGYGFHVVFEDLLKFIKEYDTLP